MKIQEKSEANNSVRHPAKLFNIFGSSHVLMRLIEDWKASLDNKKLVGTVLMDCSKAFYASLMTYLL